VVEAISQAETILKVPYRNVYQDLSLTDHKLSKYILS
jgi:hypothetical protein